MLFTTLIPVYKTQFLTDTISCLNAQTLKDFSVIFSDDSPTQDAAEMLQELHAEQAFQFPYRVISGPRLGPVSNSHHLFAAWQNQSPYVHFLLDDDLITPDFYAMHAKAYAETDAKACFSARTMVNEKKTEIEAAPIPPKTVLPHSQTIETFGFAACAASILPTCDNWLGELSNATFHGATMSQTITGSLAHLPYYGLNDLGIFLEMLRVAPAAYIYRVLGAFRVNRLQTSGNPRSRIFKSTVVSWLSLALDALHLGAITPEMCIQNIAKVKTSIDNLAPNNPELQALAAMLAKWQTQTHDLASFEQSFSAYWLAQVASYPDYTRACELLTQTGSPPLPTGE